MLLQQNDTLFIRIFKKRISFHLIFNRFIQHIQREKTTFQRHSPDLFI